MQLLIASSIAVSTSGRRAFKSTVDVTAALVIPIAAPFISAAPLLAPRNKQENFDAPLSAAREERATSDVEGRRSLPEQREDAQALDGTSVANDEPGSRTDEAAGEPRERWLTLIIAPATISTNSHNLPPPLPFLNLESPNPTQELSTPLSHTPSKLNSTTHNQHSRP